MSNREQERRKQHQRRQIPPALSFSSNLDNMRQLTGQWTISYSTSSHKVQDEEFKDIQRKEKLERVASQFRVTLKTHMLTL